MKFPAFTFLKTYHLLSFKKLVIFFIMLLTITSFFSSAFAQSNNNPIPSNTTAQSNNQQYLTPNTNPDVPQNLHTYTQSVFLELGVTAICYLGGVDITRPDGRCLGIDPHTGKIGYAPAPNNNLASHGLIGFMGSAITQTFSIPVSTKDYASYLSSNFGIAKKAYAQSIGFDGLKPLLNMWRALRDIAYIAFVIVFIIVGLGVMFRFQIDPRTVMTIQNQIPKIIITLLLITFSYAIAGFLIDMMWVLIYLSLNLLAKVAPGAIDITQATQDLAGRNALEFANSNVSLGGGGILSIVTNAAGSVSSIVASMLTVTDGFGRFMAGLIGAVIGVMAGGLACGPLVWLCVGAGAAIGGFGGGFFAGDIFGFVAGFLAFLVFLITVLYALFRVWFTLIKAYVYILMAVVFAPFWIMLGLFPGSPTGFNTWIRHMLAYLSAFPVTIIMFIVAKIFMSEFLQVNTTNPFIPPLIGNPNIANVMSSLIGVGVLLLTTEVVTIMKDALKAPDFKYLGAIGRNIGVGTGATSLPGRAGQFGYTIGGLRNVPLLKSLPGIRGAETGAGHPHG